MTHYTDEQLDNWFTRRELDVESKADMDAIRAHALALAKKIRDHCPMSMQMHRALESLQEAIFWAEASVTQGGV